MKTTRPIIIVAAIVMRPSRGTFPATMWLSRLFGDRPRDKAIAQALRIVDDNFGYNRLLGLQRLRMGIRLLVARGELSKLIAWYSR